MRDKNKGCDSEFIHIDPDEADLRDKSAACLWNNKWQIVILIMISELINVWLIWNYLVREFKMETN